MERLEGKLRILLLSFILDLCGFVSLLISFVTPYWIISWPRVYSPFRRMGLWEVCFYGLILEYDPTQKAYHGCWWILAPELYAIQSWIMPPWFIVVQILMSISVFLEIIVFVLDIILWITSTKKDSSGLGKKRAPYNIVQCVTYITLTTAILKLISVLIFGLAYKYDPFWLPKPEIIYPHFSYGLAIISTFLSIFSSMGHIVHRNIVKVDDYISPAGHAPYSQKIHIPKV